MTIHHSEIPNGQIFYAGLIKGRSDRFLFKKFIDDIIRLDGDRDHPLGYYHWYTLLEPHTNLTLHNYQPLEIENE